VVDVVSKISKEAPKKPSSARNGGCFVDFYRKGTTATTKVTGATDPDDLVAQGWDLIQSIPFDCAGGTDVSGMPNEQNAYDAYQDFIRQAAEYNSQNQGNTGTGGGSGTGGGGNPQGPMEVGDEHEDPWRKKMDCLYRASTESRISKNQCQIDFNNAWNNSTLAIWGVATAAGTFGASAGGAGCTLVLPIVGTVACGAVGAAVGFIGSLTIGYGAAYFNIGENYDLCVNNATIRYQQAVRDCN
jgi:hypothetical protein